MKNAKKENITLGIIGAVVAAAVASAVWILLDQVGFIASFAAVLMFIGSIKGYEILGGKISRKGLVACVIITVIMVFVADYISLALDIYREYSDYDITLMDAIFATASFFEYPEVKSSFLLNLVMGYVFVALGCVKSIKNIWNSLGEVAQQDAVYEEAVSENVTLVNGEVPDEAFVAED